MSDAAPKRIGQSQDGYFSPPLAHDHSEKLAPAE